MSCSRSLSAESRRNSHRDPVGRARPVELVSLFSLRMIGRRNAALKAAAVATAGRRAAATSPAARWVGKDALRDLASPATKRRLARRR